MVSTINNSSVITPASAQQPKPLANISDLRNTPAANTIITQLQKTTGATSTPASSAAVTQTARSLNSHNAASRRLERGSLVDIYA